MRSPHLVLVVALAVLASPAFADDAADAHVWRQGCENCERIEPPPYMAGPLAALRRGRDEVADLRVLGPACRHFPPRPDGGGLEVCGLEQVSGCGFIDVVGRNGRIDLFRFGGNIGPDGCTETGLRRFLRFAAEALLACHDGPARQASLDLMLTQPLAPGSETPGEATDGPDIREVCGTMRGSRSIDRTAHGTREIVVLQPN